MAQVDDQEGLFAAFQAWMMDNLASDLRVERLAERAVMSPRTFASAFAARMGAPPAKAVEVMRVEAARRMLEQQPGSLVGAIARRCGFNDDERMRRAFLRTLGVGPAGVPGPLRRPIGETMFGRSRVHSADEIESAGHVRRQWPPRR